MAAALPPEPPASTLGSVLDALTPALVELVVAPLGLEVGVRAVAIVEVRDLAAAGADEVLLAVGVDPASRELLALLDRSDERRPAAVVVRGEDVPEAVRAAAERSGIALARVGASTDWGQLYTLARTALASRSPQAAAPNDAPLGDLFALANAIAATVGGSTTIEDARLQLVAHSNLAQPIDEVRRDSILGRRVPDALRTEAGVNPMYRRIWRQRGAVLFAGSDDGTIRSRLAVAVRAGDEVLGSIWVVEGDRPFDERSASTLSEAAELAALHLLRHRADADVERRRRAELVRGALAGRLPRSAVPRGLGIAGDDLVTVVVLQTAGASGDDEPATVARRERLVELVALRVEAYRHRAACVEHEGLIHVLVPEPRDVSLRHQRDVVREAVTRASHALKATVVAGIGATVPPSEVERSWWEAEQACLVAAERGATDVVHVDEARADIVVNVLRELLSTDDRLRTDDFRRLADHDAHEGSDHLATVRAYLQAFGDVPVAATALGIHPNTLRYRLRRMREQLGIDLRDPVARFVLELQLRAGPGSGPGSGLNR